MELIKTKLLVPIIMMLSCLYSTISSIYKEYGKKIMLSTILTMLMITILRAKNNEIRLYRTFVYLTIINGITMQ